MQWQYRDIWDAKVSWDQTFGVLCCWWLLCSRAFLLGPSVKRKRIHECAVPSRCPDRQEEARPSSVRPGIWKLWIVSNSNEDLLFIYTYCSGTLLEGDICKFSTCYPQVGPRHGLLSSTRSCLLSPLFRLLRQHASFLGAWYYFHCLPSWVEDPCFEAYQAHSWHTKDIRGTWEYQCKLGCPKCRGTCARQ